MEILLSILTAVRELAVIGAAAFGIYFGWQRLLPAQRQADAADTHAKLARRSHVTELFNRAVGQLRDKNLEVRLAAIYVLREIANDFPDLSDPVFQTLQAFVRESGTEYGDDDPPVDIQAIFDILKDKLGER